MRHLHLQLVSDATGETLHGLSKAATAQFEKVECIEHPWSFVRSAKHVEQVLEGIDDKPGIVVFTLVNTELRDALVEGCQERNVTCLAVLDPLIASLSSFLGEEAGNLPGRQHALDKDYFERIDALHFSMSHDDGLSTDDLETAEVIIVGVSRTTKTPTCIYLANRGIRAANVPIVPGCPLPKELDDTKSDAMIVGLTISPERLIPIRRNRLIGMQQEESAYVDEEDVREEVMAARRLFTAKGWPVVDVSRRSIEETAAAILNLLARRQEETPQEQDEDSGASPDV